eukprot:CAMPEP_0174246192 /NCGR_PEP_ID=MMETSP0417-20130205/41949_1 /TAXON_ID=242541 /ORGANISM="Mayorella sp, Strain BSH-02190019" /LENGTH=1406 /DNA_ID=CAMNT_0015326045 /DNA_START=84 /DNA_END=4304 /DNA_ORIENTATION=+
MALPHYIARSEVATARHGEDGQPMETTNSGAASSEKLPLFDYLKSCVAEMELTELHTHLLGMGSWDFWMNEVMEKRIPELKAKFEKYPHMLEYYTTHTLSSLSHASVFNLRPSYEHKDVTADILRDNLIDRCSPALVEELKHNRALRWTADVVYSVETWMKALNVKSVQEIASQFALGNREASAQLADELRQRWFVFNARDQVFEFRQGLTNEQLLGYRKKFKIQVDAVLKNCFTMLNPDGSPQADHMVTTYYQGQFTPEFYPRRFALKDDMYSQYLLVLDELLAHVLTRYRESGCGYVEFSVGFNDLIMRPWVFRHLYEVAHREKSVTTRFLAGFGRHESVPYPGTLEALEEQDDPMSQELVLQLKAGTRAEVDLCLEPALYRRHLVKLDVMRSLFFPKGAGLTKDKHKAAQKLCEVVVGLDYLADERDHPFCPFGLPRFIDFVNLCRQQFNGRFGVRYHCGEFALDRSKKEHFVHMQISARIITAILTGIDGDATPLRIGHGIAFLPFRDCLTNPYCSKPEEDIKQALELMKNRGAPIEVNLRSNELLVAGLRENHVAVRVFSQSMHLPVVLSTDNDGIWNVHTELDGAEFISVAGEFALAIEQNVIPDLVRARHFVEDSKNSRFDYAPNPRECLHAQKLPSGSHQPHESAVPSAAHTSLRPSLPQPLSSVGSAESAWKLFVGTWEKLEDGRRRSKLFITDDNQLTFRWPDGSELKVQVEYFDGARSFKASVYGCISTFTLEINGHDGSMTIKETNTRGYNVFVRPVSETPSSTVRDPQVGSAESAWKLFVGTWEKLEDGRRRSKLFITDDNQLTFRWPDGSELKVQVEYFDGARSFKASVYGCISTFTLEINGHDGSMTIKETNTRGYNVFVRPVSETPSSTVRDPQGTIDAIDTAYAEYKGKLRAAEADYNSIPRPPVSDDPAVDDRLRELSHRRASANSLTSIVVYLPDDVRALDDFASKHLHQAREKCRVDLAQAVKMRSESYITWYSNQSVPLPNYGSWRGKCKWCDESFHDGKKGDKGKRFEQCVKDHFSVCKKNPTAKWDSGSEDVSHDYILLSEPVCDAVLPTATTSPSASAVSASTFVGAASAATSASDVLKARQSLCVPITATNPSGGPSTGPSHDSLPASVARPSSSPILKDWQTAQHDELFNRFSVDIQKVDHSSWEKAYKHCVDSFQTKPSVGFLSEDDQKRIQKIIQEAYAPNEDNLLSFVVAMSVKTHQVWQEDSLYKDAIVESAKRESHRREATLARSAWLKLCDLLANDAIRVLSKRELASLFGRLGARSDSKLEKKALKALFEDLRISRTLYRFVKALSEACDNKDFVEHVKQRLSKAPYGLDVEFGQRRVSDEEERCASDFPPASSASDAASATTSTSHLETTASETSSFTVPDPQGVTSSSRAS